MLGWLVPCGQPAGRSQFRVRFNGCRWEHGGGWPPSQGGRATDGWVAHDNEVMIPVLFVVVVLLAAYSGCGASSLYKTRLIPLRSGSVGDDADAVPVGGRQPVSDASSSDTLATEVVLGDTAAG